MMLAWFLTICLVSILKYELFSLICWFICLYDSCLKFFLYFKCVCYLWWREFVCVQACMYMCIYAYICVWIFFIWGFLIYKITCSIHKSSYSDFGCWNFYYIFHFTDIIVFELLFKIQNFIIRDKKKKGYITCPTILVSCLLLFITFSVVSFASCTWFHFILIEWLFMFRIQLMRL